MQCLSCQREVIYCGIPVAHYGRVVPLQNEQEPFERHSCPGAGGGFALAQEKYIVPMYDGRLILCIDVGLN